MVILERLTELGWEKKEFYAPGSSTKTGHEYFYGKNQKQIRVNQKTNQIFSYDGNVHREIKTEFELSEYEKQ
jgi:hypothetical protein